MLIRQGESPGRGNSLGTKISNQNPPLHPYRPIQILLLFTFPKCFHGCVNSFAVAMIKFLTKASLGRKFFFSLRVLWNKVYHGKQGIQQKHTASLPSYISSKEERVNRKQGQAKAQSQVLLTFASSSKEPSEVPIIFPNYHLGTKCSTTWAYGGHFIFFKPQQCWTGFLSHSSCLDDIILLSSQWTKWTDLFIHGSILVLCF